MNEQTRKFVDSQMRSLANGPETQDVDDLLGHNRRSGLRIALGLLYLGDVGQAQDWFAPVAEEFESFYQVCKEDLLEVTDEPRAGRFEWSALLRGVECSVLSADDAVINAVATAALEASTDPHIARLPGANGNPRISEIAAITATILDRDPSEHLERIGKRVRIADNEYNETVYPIASKILEGIWKKDAIAVEKGITTLQEPHQEFTQDVGTTHFTEAQVDLDACAFVALARSHGLEVRAESEYIPNAVYDDEFYPVG